MPVQASHNLTLPANSTEVFPGGNAYTIRHVQGGKVYVQAGDAAPRALPQGRDYKISPDVLGEVTLFSKNDEPSQVVVDISPE